MSERETWGTRLGFILASVGSAVGLGNIWRFPFQTAESGGAAFLVVYLLAVLVIGIPAILAEFVVGRRANINVIDAFGRLGHRQWTFVGVLGLVGGFWTLSYYSVVGGWVVRYLGGSVTGAALTAPGEYFGTVSAGPDALAFHLVFMAITVAIVALGVERGIELATKVMVPSIVVLMAGLAAYAATLPGAGAGYAFFLSPDFGTLVANADTVVPAAVGQALFSLSLGFGAMVTYASYIGEDADLTVDGLSIAVSNTSIGILAGLLVFPLLFAQGVSPDAAGPGAVFVSVPTALADLGTAGRLVGVVFFGVVLIAALSSAISLLEVVVAYLVDTYGVGRVPTAVGLGAVIATLGVPSALDTAWLGWFDGIAVAFFLPLAVLFIVGFVGWVLGRDAVAEFRKGADGSAGLAIVWLWGLRTLVLLAVLGVVALNLYDLFVTPEAGYYFVPPL